MHASLPDAVAVEIRRRVAATARRRGAPGAQYRLVHGGRLLLEHCEGVADAVLKAPVTPATTFNLYSITKSVTAATVLALVRDGRLALDGSIGEAAGVDGLQAYGSVGDTLLHRAGFRNPNPLRWIHRAGSPAAFDEAGFVRTVVTPLAGSRRRWSRSGYSNVGYLLLGLAIERATGLPYREAVRQHVLAPIAAGTDDGWLDFDDPDPARPAQPHMRRHGLLDALLGWLVDRDAVVRDRADPWLRLVAHRVDGSAYGGLLGDARGLARFGQAVLGDVPGLDPWVRDRLLAVVPGAGPRRSFGGFAGTTGASRWIGHAGGGLGYYGEYRVYPELRAVSVLLTNGPGLSDAGELGAIDAAWLPAH